VTQELVEMSNRTRLEKLFLKHEFKDFKWINPHNIVVSQWVRMKCMFGCKDYGKNACCPPNTPPVDECKSFFREYSEGLSSILRRNLKIQRNDMNGQRALMKGF
jgi:predicted metal-binding protein